MIRRLAPLVVASLVVAFGLAPAAGTALTSTAPAWNPGYNGWWPGGYGYPPVTARTNYPCSVTAYGPTFHSHPSGWTQDYGAGTGCRRGVGSKRLTVFEQVLGEDNHTWYTISGSRFTVGPRRSNPVRFIHHRAAFLGHGYRTVAVAKLVVPNGHAGCSLSNTCNETITLEAVSRPLAP